MASPSRTAIDADELACRLLGSARTRLGGLHIDHARRVAAGVGADPRLRAVALLHDVVEKTDTSIEQLRDLVRDDWVTELVCALTHHPHETEETYLERCASHPVTLHVKRLDLEDKLTTDDVHVSPAVAATLRSEALGRLHALNALGSREPPSRNPS